MGPAPPPPPPAEPAPPPPPPTTTQATTLPPPPTTLPPPPMTTLPPPVIMTTRPPMTPPPTTLPPPPMTTIPPPPPTTTVPLGPPGVCSIYGDPHIVTFDHKHASYYTPGEYWIVKSSTVIIQGKYAALPTTNGLAVVKGIAIGGTFLHGHKLIVSTMEAGTVVTYDGAPVVNGFPGSGKTADGLVSVMYNQAGAMMDEGKGLNGQAHDGQMHVLHINLPLQVTLQVNEWNEPGEGAYMNVKITMPAQPGQDGQCGNFNGNPADDDRTQVRARLGTQGVPAGALLFPGGKTPIAAGNRPDINNCPEEKLAVYKKQCDDSSTTSMECLIDRCFGGGATR